MKITVRNLFTYRFTESSDSTKRAKPNKCLRQITFFAFIPTCRHQAKRFGCIGTNKPQSCQGNISAQTLCMGSFASLKEKLTVELKALMFSFSFPVTSDCQGSGYLPTTLQSVDGMAQRTNHQAFGTLPKDTDMFNRAKDKVTKKQTFFQNAKLRIL